MESEIIKYQIRQELYSELQARIVDANSLNIIREEKARESELLKELIKK